MNILQWARSNEGSRISWLRGHAGTGKSTIAQQCDQEKLLTFRYPYTNLPASCCLDVVEDPNIFHQTLKDQFTKLIGGPVLSIPEPVPSMAYRTHSLKDLINVLVLSNNFSLIPPRAGWTPCLLQSLPAPGYLHTQTFAPSHQEPLRITRCDQEGSTRSSKPSTRNLPTVTKADLKNLRDTQREVVDPLSRKPERRCRRPQDLDLDEITMYNQVVHVLIYCELFSTTIEAPYRKHGAFVLYLPSDNMLMR